MTEIDYVLTLKAQWPRGVGEEASRGTLVLADRAVSTYPLSPQLWVLRGDLLQLGPVDCHYPLDESLKCYRRAIALDPQFAEAWESVAHFYDAILGDSIAAAPYFEEFARLSTAKGGGPP